MVFPWFSYGFSSRTHLPRPTAAGARQRPQGGSHRRRTRALHRGGRPGTAAGAPGGFVETWLGFWWRFLTGKDLGGFEMI